MDVLLNAIRPLEVVVFRRPFHHNAQDGRSSWIYPRYRPFKRKHYNKLKELVIGDWQPLGDKANDENERTAALEERKRNLVMRDDLREIDTL